MSFIKYMTRKTVLLRNEFFPFFHLSGPLKKAGKVFTLFNGQVSREILNTQIISYALDREQGKFKRR